VNKNEQAVSVLSNALVTFAGLEKVVVVRERQANEKTVATGRRGADWVEIVSGLSAGEGSGALTQPAFAPVSR